MNNVDFIRKLVDDRTLYTKNGGRLRFKPISNLNTSNDAEMVNVGQRHPRLFKDQSVFTKTINEKKRLKKIKTLIKDSLRAQGLNSKKIMNAKPTEIVTAFNQFDMGSNTGLAKSISSVDPTKFCTLHGYLIKQQRRQNA